MTQGTNSQGPNVEHQKTSIIARVLGLIILAGILVLLFPIAYRFVEFRAGHSITDDAFVEAQMVHVSPEGISGRIIRMAVRENDTVKKGDVLFEIDPVTYKDQVAMAETKLQMALTEQKRQKIAVEKLKKEVPLTISMAQKTLELSRAEQAKMGSVLTLTSEEVAGTISESEALVGVAQANQTLAKQEFERFAALYQQNAITLRRAQEVSRTNESTKAELRLAESKKGKALSARTQIEVAAKDLDAAKASTEKAHFALALAETGNQTILEAEQMLRLREEAVREAQTLLHTAKHHLENTKITAPISGVVVKRMKNTGDSVTMGIPILTMYDPDMLFVTANMEETRLKGIAPGNRAEIHVDATGETIMGRVLWLNRSTGAEFSLLPRNVVSGEFTKVVQRVPIKIVLENSDKTNDIRAGLSVRVAILHGKGDQDWVKKARNLEKELDTRFDETENAREE
jgi:membrane fusion protein (multidrug efflux system)